MPGDCGAQPAGCGQGLWGRGSHCCGLSYGLVQPWVAMHTGSQEPQSRVGVQWLVGWVCQAHLPGRTMKGSLSVEVGAAPGKEWRTGRGEDGKKILVSSPPPPQLQMLDASPPPQSFHGDSPNTGCPAWLPLAPGPTLKQV